MDSSSTHLLLLALSWIAYGALHSLTASFRFKQAFQKQFASICHAYRFLFNLSATLLLVIPIALLWRYEGATLWHWPQPISYFIDTVAWLGIAGFVLSFSLYDGSDFLGIKQLRTRQQSITEDAPMSLSWLHRYVRHPWYFFGLIIIWFREMNAAYLLSAVILTLYLIIGSRLEEAKLLALYGKQYQKYMAKVPGLVPLPWRFLRKVEAAALLSDSAGK